MNMKQYRCPNCSHRLFDFSDDAFGKLRTKCRRCKTLICFEFPSAKLTPLGL